MKYYIIFNSKGKYIGYTTNKKLLNAFLQERGESKYKVEKINEENLSEQMKKTIKSSFSDLYYLYITDKEKIAIFSNEDASFETHMIESMIRSRSSLDRLLKSNKLLKLSEDDQKVVDEAISIMDDTLNNIMEDTLEPEYRECFDVSKWIKEFLDE